MRDLWQDLRYAVRTFQKQPGFASAVVLMLALGIGANTAIFTLINAVMFRSLPVPTPEQLVAVGDPSRPTALWEGGPMVDVLSYPMYQRLRDHNKAFSERSDERRKHFKLTDRGRRAAQAEARRLHALVRAARKRKLYPQRA